MATNMPLPAGFKLIFDPTDEQLLVDYLLNKVRGWQLPCNEVIECDLYGECRVWSKLFVESGRDVMYFFTRLRKKTSKGLRIERVTECGTWRAQSDAKVYWRGNGNGKQHIGSKRSFSFVPKKGCDNGGLDMKGWVMHEYRLDGCLLDNGCYNGDSNCMDDYVLCRVKRKVKKSDQVDDLVRVENFQNSMVPMPAAPTMMMIMQQPQQQQQQEEEACVNVTAAATCVAGDCGAAATCVAGDCGAAATCVAEDCGAAANFMTLLTYCPDMSDFDDLDISLKDLDNFETANCLDSLLADDHNDDGFDNYKRVGSQEVLPATVSFGTNSTIQQEQHQQHQPEQLKSSSNNTASAAADNGTMEATGSAGLEGAYLWDVIRLDLPELWVQ